MKFSWILFTISIMPFKRVKMKLVSRLTGTMLPLLLLLFPSAGHSATMPEVKKAVVKIYTVYNRFNYHEPWQTIGQCLYQGSGCVISGERILTNAHVVSDRTFIQVRRAGEARRYTARVEAVAHECDLALLKVDDPAFFKGVTPLEIGDLPMIRDKVAVYGYPDGGDTLSITEGVVSRVEHQEYMHSHANLMACQIDAPINSGNSGGPVIRGDKLAGIAFQGLNGPSYENIGYMVPSPVIRHFLRDVADGRPDSIPELGIAMQRMENPDLRRRFRMAENMTGVLVNRIFPDSPADGILVQDDIILAVGGSGVENDGTIAFRPGERTYLGYAWQQKQIGDDIGIKILRDGNVRTVTVRLSKAAGFERLVPGKFYDRPATYYVIGGLVFEPLTLNYLEEYGTARDWAVTAPKDLLFYYLHGEPTVERRQVVLLAKVLADEANVGYHEYANGIIERVNGRHVGTLRDLMDAFEKNAGPFHVIEDMHGNRLVLDRKKVETRGPEILKRYRVPFDRSEDLRK